MLKMLAYTVLTEKEAFAYMPEKGEGEFYFNLSEENFLFLSLDLKKCVNFHGECLIM